MQDMKRYAHLAIVAMIGIFSHFPLSTQGPQLMYRKYKRYQCGPELRTCLDTRLLLVHVGWFHVGGSGFTRRQTPVSPAG